jgi:vacuolar-type H+-ATPase subunit H
MSTTDSSGYGATYPSETTESSKADVAKEQASQVAGSAKEQATQVASSAKDSASEVASTATEKAGQVADTAKAQAQEVISEATSQVKNLAGELRGQVDEQVGTQRDRVIEQLRAISDDLTTMVQGGEPTSGVAAELVGQVNDRLQGAVGFLDGKEAADLLSAAQDYARRKPGTFLLGAAIAGLVAGRLTRGIRSASSDSDSGYEAPQSTGYEPTYAPVPPTTYTEIPSSTYPTTVSSAGGFSTTDTGYLGDGGSAGPYSDDTYATGTDQGQRL